MQLIGKSGDPNYSLNTYSLSTVASGTSVVRVKEVVVVVEAVVAKVEIRLLEREDTVVAVLLSKEQPSVERGNLEGEPPPLTSLPMTSDNVRVNEATKPPQAP